MIIFSSNSSCQVTVQGGIRGFDEAQKRPEHFHHICNVVSLLGHAGWTRFNLIKILISRNNCKDLITNAIQQKLVWNDYEVVSGTRSLRQLGISSITENKY